MTPGDREGAAETERPDAGAEESATRMEALPLTPQGRSSSRRTWVWERFIVDALFRRIGSPEVEIALWDGTVLGDRSAPQGRIVLQTPRALRRLILNPRIGFGEAYMAHELDVQGELIAVITALNRGLSRCTPSRRAAAWSQWRPWLTHSLHQSRACVEHHYDIGNDFYRIWLDRQLVYTCAYYPQPQASLDEAQTAKLDYVCRKLRLKPGERVAEAGCGWGALALHMARHYGVTVRAWNLSQEQIAYARQRAVDEGLTERVTFLDDDYRHITGEFDVFVSIGMLEHVGPRQYAGLGRLMDRVLAPRGRGLIHTIGRNYARALDPWTLKYIFPGACPPSLRQMMDLFESSGFSVLDVENLRLHYARTCADWLARYEQHIDRVREMYDETFVRMWRLYLAASSAAFVNGDLQLFQVVFNRAADNTLLTTRADWYSPPADSRT
ncbi:MAG: cyclopropane-fatty-acyl-phospholipid synthase family protein [Planctomycetaceae bacterium]|nr:cyclopropane-fatty-acyl-phospholipid synthase family protein [Planctomycetaceae bacterium]